MLLVCDLGNIQIDIGIYEERKLRTSFRISSESKRTSDEYGIILLDLLKANAIAKEEIDGAIIASTIPEVMHSFTNSLRKYLSIESMIVGPGLKSGVAIRYANPKEVGSDRIVTANGAISEYGRNLLIIDFSTAITFDYIDDKGDYRGGSIIPGVEIAAKALSDKAAKLPDIEIKECDSVFADDTIGAMQAGLYLGYLGLVESMIERFRYETGRDLKVIATGGIGRIFAKNSDKIDIYDNELAFKGLRNIYFKNKEK